MPSATSSSGYRSCCSGTPSRARVRARVRFGARVRVGARVRARARARARARGRARVGGRGRGRLIPTLTLGWGWG